MGATAEAYQHPAEEYRSSSLKRPLTLRRRSLRLSLDPDGSVRYLESASERRLLFGREQMGFYRARAGVLLQAQRIDWKAQVSPLGVSLSGLVFESLEVAQRVGILPAPVEGYYRVVSVRNAAATAARLRLLCIQDPTAAHFRDSQFPWGSLGVNAFNRSNHVALDEVASPPSARILGSVPGPKFLYMTSDAAKASDLFAAGELPEQTAGMSGQVIVMAQHDLEIPAGGTIDLPMLAIYDRSKLESALANFDKLRRFDFGDGTPEFDLTCSSPGISAASRWAASTLGGVQYETDELDRYEALRFLPFIDFESAKAIVSAAKEAASKDGWLRHSLDPSKPGLLETSALLLGATTAALLSPDKKYPRSIYPLVRRLATFLAKAQREGIILTDGSLPQGWRRRVGKGYPTGEIPEVTLAVVAALEGASSLAARLSKAEDSTRWSESANVMVDSLKRRAVGEQGLLPVSIEGGVARNEETIDQAVACYRRSLSSAIDSHVVRRLLEKDFDSPWGPRTVPTSNRTYFNSSYGEGQLGGYWTRAAIAHAVASYRAGLAGIGGIEVESISRLPLADALKLGGSPGEFPYWIDPQRREIRDQGSDPVAAARFLEAIICCELGLKVSPSGFEIAPSPSSRLKWMLVSGLLGARKTNVFLGRAEGGTYVLAGMPECKIERGLTFAGSESALVEGKGVVSASFFSPGQAICLGNTLEAPVKTKVSFTPRDHALSRHLSVKLQRLDKASGSWETVSPIRVLSPMSFEVALGPTDWAVFRVSTGS